MARRAASLLVLAAAAAQSPYSAEQRQDFERTRQELLARDPRVTPQHSERENISLAENASRYGQRFAEQFFGFFEAL